MSRDQVSRIQQQFTRTAEIYARMRQNADERALDGLATIADAPASARALDVACGPGFLTLALARRYAEATGFDATDAFLAMARAEAAERGLRNVRFEQGDAESLPFDDDAFDLVTCRAAFHHFPRPERVMAEIARVTAPGGRILVADMLGSEDPERAAMHDRIERLCDPTHERALPASALLRIFEDAGLIVVREIDAEMSYELDEWMDHGAPAQHVRREIRALMESCLEDDKAGLDVRTEDGAIHFTHRTAAFVLEHAPTDVA